MNTASPTLCAVPPLLQLDRVTIRFGGLTAVSELNLQVNDRELVGLIGPNGAGKTTAFNLITGVYQPTDGAISFNGQPTKNLKPHHLARRGIARTFQNIRLFASIAGGLYAHYKQFLSPTGFDFMRSIDIVVMVILGGMGRTAGVIVATVLLTLLPEWLRGFAEYRMIIYALLIMVLMIARPQGLFAFGKRSKTK